MTDFFAMGGYALYVWGSYGAAAVILGLVAFLSFRRMRASAARLEALRQAAPHRRRNRETADGAQ